MTTIIGPFDLTDAYLFPADDKIRFASPHEPQCIPVSLRIFINAVDRGDWCVSEVHMVTEELKGIGPRTEERIFVLSDQLLIDAKEFLHMYRDDFIQDKVDLAIVPSWDDKHPYVPVTI